MGGLDQADELALHVRLMERHRDSELIGQRLAARLDLIEHRRAVDVRLADTEEIEIGSVEDHDPCGHFRLSFFCASRQTIWPGSSPVPGIAPSRTGRSVARS